MNKCGVMMVPHVLTTEAIIKKDNSAILTNSNTKKGSSLEEPKKKGKKIKLVSSITALKTRMINITKMKSKIKRKMAAKSTK